MQEVRAQNRGYVLVHAVTLPSNIDPQLLDEAAATVAGALGLLDDIPQELANTVVNCYYRFLRFAKIQHTGTQSPEMAQRESAMEAFKRYSRDSANAIADVEFIAQHITAIRGVQPKTDRLDAIRDIMIQVTLDTFKYRIDDANKKNGIRRAIERRFKKVDEVEELYILARPLIASYAAARDDRVIR